MTITYQVGVPEAGPYWELFDSTGWNSDGWLTAERLYRAIRGSWHIICAYDEGCLVASGRIISDGAMHAFLTELMVLPEYQGRGIGSVILEALLARCDSSGIRDVQLFCAPGKAAFYHRRGFVDRPSDAPGMQYRPAD